MQNCSSLVAGFFIIITILIANPVSAAHESCSLSVESIPQEGEVIVDGTNYGNTPVMDIPLIPGLHTIGVHKGGYTNYTSTVSIEEGTRRDIIANLERLPDRGQVTIRSEPPGADLYVDGQVRGMTPLTVDNLLPGRHEILIRKTGYENYQDVISVVTDITIEYTEYLVPLPGTGFLSVTSFPEGADVCIDGTDAGKTPTNLQRIDAGNHTVDIYKVGYWNFTGIVNIKGGEAMQIKADLNLIPTSCTLYLDSSPQGLGIYLNGTFKGSTPATLEMLPSGDYLLEFHHQNDSSVNRSFHFLPGGTYEIFATLNNETQGSIISNEWLYQNDSPLTAQPGWTSVNTTPIIERTFTWYTNGHKATITLDIPQDLYDDYRNKTHPKTITPDTIGNYAINERDRQYLHPLINRLKDASDFKSYSARNDYRNVVSFVQSIVYKDDIDPVTKQLTEYGKYPIETLADGNGDCEDTAILTATLLKEMGHDVAIVLPPGHAAVAVACDNCNGYYYPLNGKKYYFLETTGSGFSLGDMGKEYQTEKAKVILF
jgi:hypothetical protein